MNSKPDKSTEQKRRRVTRACDTCRSKKVKCDGKQPCIHCTVYSYNCTYDAPNIRNKKNSGIPAPSFPVLPANMKGTLIQKTPSVTGDAQKNSASLVLFQNLMDLMFPKFKVNVLDDKPLNFDFDKFQKVLHYLNHRNAGTVTLSDIKNLYSENVSPTTSPKASSISSEDNPIGREIRLDLPPKEVTLQLVYVTWNKACVLFRFYHRPSLLEEIELLYSLDPMNYTDRQQKFLPFLYSVLACGSLFSRSSTASSPSNDSLEDDGFKYFLEARKLIDITNVGDIVSIQTIVMMIIYLQCSARLSTCYSYIGIALRSALKEGLHRNLSIFQDTRRKLDPIEVDTRKRLFYTIYKMDVYINSLLGLPQSLSEDEFDQSFPEDLDDENVTRDGYNTSAQQGRLSSAACANHHTKLMIIISHIVRELYPIKVKKNPDEAQMTPNHMHNKVTALELELKQWLENLPKELKPSDPSDPNSTRHIPEKFVLANYYLHLAFLNCQIMLYRPFIHFISHGNQSKASDPRSLIRGRNCIKVARLVVKLANKMIDQNLLVGTYWFSMYTIFFSIACLIYYFHFVHNSNGDSHNGANYVGVFFDDDLDIDKIKKDIEVGKRVLDCLKSNSNASLRIYKILNNLFEQLNRRTADTSKEISPLLAQASFNNIPRSQVNSTLANFDTINLYGTPNDGKSNGINDAEPMDASPAVPSQTTAAISNAVFSPRDINMSAIKMEDPAHSQLYETTKANEPTSVIPVEPHSFSAYPIKKSFSRPGAHDNLTNFVPPRPESASRATDTSEEVEYVPGVMDMLDAQIFGRILPPYMLEKNEQNPQGAANAAFLSKSDSAVDQSNANNNMAVDSNSLRNLSFSDIDINFGDNANLSYLDPFTQG